MMTGPPDDVYEAAARAYDEAGSWTDPIFALRAAADSAYAAGVAAGRAQAAADIRDLRGKFFPADMTRAPYWNSLSGPQPQGLIEWAARVAERKSDD